MTEFIDYCNTRRLINYYNTVFIYYCTTEIVQYCTIIVIHYCKNGFIHTCITEFLHYCTTGLIHAYITTLSIPKTYTFPTVLLKCYTLFTKYFYTLYHFITNVQLYYSLTTPLHSCTTTGP